MASDCVPPDKGMARSTLDSMLLAADSHVSKHTLKMPWEKGSMKAIFDARPNLMPAMPVIQAPLQSEPLDSSTFEEAAVKAQPPVSVSQFAQVAFSARRFQKPMETEEQQLHLLAVRFEVLLGHAYECSSLGRVIKGRPEAERVSLVSEALGGKSVSTLKKRLSSLTKLVGWCSGQGMSAFPLDSQVLIEYTGHLISTGARHSAFGSCLESCNFARHILGLDVVGEPLKHPLIQGRVRNVRFHRPPRKQARPFQVREVAFLEAFIQDPSKDVCDRYAAGACLFCIHSRARLGDVRAVKHMTLDFAEGEGFLECVSTSHKCAAVGNPLGLELSLVAPERGVGAGRWAKAWVDTWGGSGHPVPTGPSSLPLLQSPMLKGSWSGRKISSDKFIAWISAILRAEGSGMGDDLTGHSCKHTALSWAGKANLHKDTCAILGHHSLKDRRSVVTYSRDIQAGPLRELSQMYSDIRGGRFLPDMTRSGLFPKETACSDSLGNVFADAAERDWYRPVNSPPPVASPDVAPSEPAEEQHPVDALAEHQFSAAVDQLLDDAERAAWDQHAADYHVSEEECLPASSGESSSDDSASSSSSSDIDEALTNSHSAPRVGQKYHDRCPVYQQKSTKTLHLKPAGSSDIRFICGREITANHKPFTSAVQASHWRCKQCWKGKPIRDLGSLVHCLDERLKKLPRTE